MRIYLNDDWKYFSAWSQQVFTSEEGESVRLPHANVQTPFNCFDESIYQFESGYKRVLNIKNKSGSYLLTFEGVAHFAEVFINGQSVATHANGYTAFTVDATSFLHEGENQIVVRVDSRESLNQPPFGYVIDYLTYGGIYRDVYLDVHQGAFVSDVFVTAVPNSPVGVNVQLQNCISACLSAEILDGETPVWQQQFSVEGGSFSFTASPKLQLWSVDFPKLYKLKLTVDGNEYKTNFGVRSAVFTADGFYLNGKKLKIVGLNRHQSFPYVGYAMPESMQRRDAQLLKNTLCCNAVRTSHYPQSQYFLDECDKLGLLVFTEIPGWQHIGDEDWKQLAVNNVKEMVLQNRNHPSVVLWGVRINESLDCDELYKQTNAVAHKLDPTRQTGGVRYLTNSHLLEDVYTFNDFNRAGATSRKKVCSDSVPYLVTEYNGHMFPTKPCDDLPHQREHVLRYARMLDGVFKSKTTCGAFGWCTFDYNTHKDFGSGDRICYHGVTDMFRNPKMAAGVFSAMGKTPFLDVCFSADIGDYPEGNVGELYCLTNAEYVDLYNGKTFIKRYTHANSPFKNMPNPPILLDDLIGDRMTQEDGIAPRYAKLIKQVIVAVRKQGASAIAKNKLKIAIVMMGTGMGLEKLRQIYDKYQSGWGGAAGSLTLVAFSGGKEVAKKVVATAHSKKLVLEVSSLVLTEKVSYDVSAVNFRMVDQNGNVLPYVSHSVQLRTEGAVQLVGPSIVPLSGGRGGTYVRTIGQKGKGKLFADELEVEFTVE